MQNSHGSGSDLRESYAIEIKETGTLKSLLFYAIAWLCVLLVGFVFAAPLSDFLFMFMPLLTWSMILAGGLLAILGMVSIKSEPRQCIAVLVICALGFTLYYSNLGFEWGRLALFQIRKPTYVQQLAEAHKQGRVPEAIGLTSDGPKKFHGFYWQRGLLDNFSMVVHDPSGEIARINEANGMDEVHANELSDLFGGTYYRCQAMGGGWYICWFT